MTKTPEGLISLLLDAQSTINSQRAVIEALSPKAQAFDLLVHTHLGGRYDGVAYAADIAYNIAVAVDQLHAINDAEQQAAAVKAAEKAKAGKVRKPRKPKTPVDPPAGDAPPAAGTEAGSGTEDPNPPTAADPAPEGGLRRTRFFGGEPAQS